jgi:hypothetical protein
MRHVARGFTSALGSDPIRSKEDSSLLYSLEVQTRLSVEGDPPDVSQHQF